MKAANGNGRRKQPTKTANEAATSGYKRRLKNSGQPTRPRNPVAKATQRRRQTKRRPTAAYSGDAHGPTETPNVACSPLAAPFFGRCKTGSAIRERTARSKTKPRSLAALPYSQTPVRLGAHMDSAAGAGRIRDNFRQTLPSSGAMASQRGRSIPIRVSL
jgi:hypothetical protein